MKKDRSSPQMPQKMKSSKAFRKSQKRELQIEKLELRQLLARVIWDGGGDGSSWHDRLNWQGDATPVSGDDVEINAALTRVRISQNIEVASLTAISALLVEGNARLTLGGSSQVSGELTLSSGTSLIVTGAGATFSAIASAFISGANITANSGAVVSIPKALEYQHAGTSNNLSRTIRAEGIGSRINLTGLTNIVGGENFGSAIFFEALSGGAIDLSSVREILDPQSGNAGGRRINLSASNQGSILLDKLLVATDQVLDSSWTIASGGSINLPELKNATGITLVVDASTLTAPKLEFFRQGSISIKAGANLVPAQLRNIDGTSIDVMGGALLSIPLVTAYSHGSTGNSQHRALQAKGVGSRLELPNVQLISGGTHYNSRIFVNALEGGVVDLSKVTQIVDPSTGDLNFRSIDVSANGTGSLVRLDELSTYIDNYGSDLSNGMYSTLSAKLGGEVRIPKLTQADGLNIELDATGVIPIGQLTRFDGGRILVSNTNKAFSGLVEANDTDIEVVGGSGNFPALKYIDGNSLLVSGGGVLSLPLVTTYSHGSTGNNQQRVLQAKGASSRLELPNAQLISGGTHYNSRIFVNALEGGVVDLSKVTQIADPSTGDLNFRSIDVSANGTGSLVRLDELSTYIDNYGSDLSNGMYSTLSAKLGGEVHIPKLTQADGLNIELDATGVIPIGQLTRFDGGRILVSNTNKAFSGLVEANDTDIEVVGGSGNFPALKYIDGNSLLVSGGGVLSLPLVTTYSHGSTGNNQQRVLQAKGSE